VLYRCGDGNCNASFVVLAEGINKSPFGVGGVGNEIIYPELQGHPRRGIPAHD